MADDAEARAPSTKVPVSRERFPDDRGTFTHPDHGAGRFCPTLMTPRADNRNASLMGFPQFFRAQLGRSLALSPP